MGNRRRLPLRPVVERARFSCTASPGRPPPRRWRRFFGKFGELKECEVVVDKVSGKSKGYGFVDYTTTDGAMAALREPRKEIDGRFTLCNPASERHKSKAPSSGPARFITSTPGGQQPGSYQPGANHAHMQYGQSAANTELLQQQLQQLQSQHQQLQNRLHQQLQQTPGGPQ
eukprot:1070030_1